MTIRRIYLTSMPALLVKRKLRWFGRAARHPEGELIKDLLLPTPPRTWRRLDGGQLKTWAATIKADLEPLSGPRVFGHARWRKDWVKVSSELAQDRRAWSASGRMPTQPTNQEASLISSGSLFGAIGFIRPSLPSCTG